MAHWRDPDFDPKQRAFYYVRVIEIPTPRWTAYDAKRFGITMPEEVTMTVQDRAYTSSDLVHALRSIAVTPRAKEEAKT